MTSYYTMQPQQYRLTHDISIENFNALPENFDDPHPYSNHSSPDNKKSFTEEDIPDGDSKEKYEKETKHIDSNKLQELDTRSQKTEASYISKDSGFEHDYVIDMKSLTNEQHHISSTANQDRASIAGFHGYGVANVIDDHVKDPLPAPEDLSRPENRSVVGKGVEGEGEGVAASGGRSAELERVYERMKELGLRKSFEDLCGGSPPVGGSHASAAHSNPPACATRNDNYMLDAETHKQHMHKPRGGKKPRRPRKLPEIPPNVVRRAPRHPVVNSRSLAEELAEADPFYRVSLTGSPSPLSPTTSGPPLPSQPCVSYQPGQHGGIGGTGGIGGQFYSSVYGEPMTPGPLRHIEDRGIFSLMDKQPHKDRALLKADNIYIKQDTSPETEEYKSNKKSLSSRSYSGDLEELEVTHRGCHKFIPRHDDEMFIEIGDPIHVEVEADDLWCEGINIRSGKRGIFPSAYATDLTFLEVEDGKGMKPKKFTVRFLGSVEVNYHKGNDVITKAINKVVTTRRMTMNTPQPPVCFLEINEYGIKMRDKESANKVSSTSKSDSLKKRLSRILSKDKDGEGGEHNLFFSLKNVSFCGYHPEENRYFGFITKHPLEMRFACHVFCSERVNSKVITDAVGVAFRTFYTQYMAFVHPTEDIYLE